MAGVQSLSAEPGRASGTERGGRKGSGPRRSKWRVYVGLGVFALVAFISLYLIWFFFNAWDPAVARFTMSQHFWFYPIVMVHTVTSSIALGTCVFGIWPWLRRTKPHIHRRIGRIYVLYGVFPACFCSAIMVVFWPEPIINEFSDCFTTVLWTVSTAVAYNMARQRRVEDHRRWMLRSVALTMSFTVSMIIILPISWILESLLHTWQFNGNKDMMTQAAAGLNVWLSWILPLLGVEWWMDYERLRRGRQRREGRKPAVAAASAGAVVPSASAAVPTTAPAAAD